MLRPSLLPIMGPPGLKTSANRLVLASCNTSSGRYGRVDVFHLSIRQECLAGQTRPFAIQWRLGPHVGDIIKALVWHNYYYHGAEASNKKSGHTLVHS